MTDIRELILRITADDDDAQDSFKKLLAAMGVVDASEATADVEAETGDALSDLLAVAAAVEALSGQEANIDVDVNTGEALSDLAMIQAALGSLHDASKEPKGELDLSRLADQVRDLNDEEVEITADTSDAERQIAEVKAAADLLSGQKRDVEVGADTSEAAAELAAIAAMAQALDDMDVEVEVKTESTKDAHQRMKDLEKNAKNLLGGVAELSGGFGRLGISMGLFTARLTPLTGLIALFVASLGVLLVGALAAVASSAVAAVAGLAALGIALAGALGPGVLLIIGAFTRLAAILDVIKAKEAEATDSASKAARGQDALAQAAKRREDAARTLARAETDLADAVVRAHQEMQDAYEETEDSIRALERAELSRERADLNVERARLNLQKLRQELGLVGKEYDAAFERLKNVSADATDLNKALSSVKGPGIDGEDQLKLKDALLDVKDAELSRKEAIDSVDDAITRRNRAEREANGFMREGIKYSKSYVAALRAREDAERGLAEAKEAQGVTAAQAKSLALTKELSDTEKALLPVLTELRNVFKEAFGPAVQGFLKGILDGLKALPGAIEQVAPTMEKLGEAMGGAFSRLLKALTSKRMLDNFEKLADAGGKLAGPIADGIAYFAGILSNIATTTLPYLLPKIQAVVDKFSEWFSKTENLFWMDGIINLLIDHFDSWWNLIKAVADLFVAFFMESNKHGQDMVEWLTQIVQGWTDMIRENPEEVKQFLKDAVQFAKDLVLALQLAVGALIKMGQVYHFFRDIVVGVNDALQAAEKWTEKAKDDIDNWVKGVKQSLEDFGGEISQWFEDLIVDIFGFASRFFRAGYNLGKSIVEGMIKGVVELAEKVGEKVKDAGGLVIKGLRVVLDAHSPSRVMVGIGEDVVRGLEIGISSGSRGLGDFAAEKLAVPMMAAPRLAAPAGGTTGGYGTYIEKQEVQLPPAPGSDMAGDPRHGAALWAREMRRQGRGGR